MPASNVTNATTVFDSALFRDAFGTPRMREVFCDRALVGRYIEAEVALARAEARCGVIPAEAAEQIAARSNLDALDFELLRHETDNVGYPILPLVHQLVEQCGEAGRYVHWGATTQDIMDTADVLQVRAALEVVEEDIARAAPHPRRSGEEAPRHADGRAHPPAAGPAGHLRLQGGDLARHVRPPRRAPAAAASRACWSASSRARPARLASLGDKGLEVQKAFCEELGLGVPVSTWHVARDGFAEVVNLLGLITGSLGKIALDVMIMASTEFAEVYEPFVKGRGASCTMPQKRNPISSELMLAASKAVRQHAGLMLDAMIQDFERATGPWHAEWIAIPESFVAHGGRAAPGEVRAGRADRRRGADAGQPRHQQGADRRRGGDDGPRAAHRPPGGARHRLRRLPRGERGRRHAGRGPGRATRRSPGISTAPPSSG